MLADHPSQSRAGDLAVVHAVLDRDPLPTVLVGHSYGGAVITDAGRHPCVRGLVYVAAFAPDLGESVDDIVTRHGAAEVFQNAARGDGLLMPGAADEDWMAHSWDVPPEIRTAAAAQRRPIQEEIFTTPAGVPAWRLLPSWYVVAVHDKHIRPDVQRMMARRADATVTEVGTSHSAPYAAPRAVATAIEGALVAVGS